jgi:hypothetical protein
MPAATRRREEVNFMSQIQRFLVAGLALVAFLHAGKQLVRALDDLG